MSKTNINVSVIDKRIASVALESNGANHKWQQKKLDTNNTVNNVIVIMYSLLHMSLCQEYFVYLQ